MKKIIKYFSVFEWCLYLSGITAIVVSFFAFKNDQYIHLISSIIGVTALIFLSKGNVLGQIISVIFSIFYGMISFSYKYYGELITYVFMTMPMAIISIVAWVKNPFSKNEVKIVDLNKKSIYQLMLFTILVTIIFYFVLKALNTTNLLISTFSVTTSFAAVFLTAKRSKYYALVYGLNDVVLVIMWTLASLDNIVYVPMIVCFSCFLINDVYAFINWGKLQKNQNN